MVNIDLKYVTEFPNASGKLALKDIEKVYTVTYHFLQHSLDKAVNIMICKGYVSQAKHRTVCQMFKSSLG